MSAPIRWVLAVVPAHDEARTLSTCLRSLRRATDLAGHRGIRSTTVLVLDACSDASTAIAARHPWIRVAEVRFGNVGRARAFGIETGLRELREDPRRVWIATTDADSAVPPGWFAQHVRIGDAGSDGFVGAVVPVLDDLDDERRAAWTRTHAPGATLGHVHGANLGVRASAYLGVGGFDALSENEDVDLVRRLRESGSRLTESEEDPVITSSRLIGRTAHGYAQYLAELTTPRAPVPGP